MQLLKLYALEGTKFYDNLLPRRLLNAPTDDFDLLGIFTIDSLSVIKALDVIEDENRDDEWVEVNFPIALIVFDEMEKEVDGLDWLMGTGIWVLVDEEDDGGGVSGPDDF